MAKYRVDAALYIYGSFDVEAENSTEAFKKIAANPEKYADIRTWDGEVTGELQVYSHYNCEECCELKDIKEIYQKEVKKE